MVKRILLDLSPESFKTLIAINITTASRPAMGPDKGKKKYISLHSKSFLTAA
jgi:hypothetical protein